MDPLRRAGRIRVGTYNLKNFFNKKTENRSEEILRAELIEETIKTTKPDILALQEVRDLSRFKKWLKETGLRKQYPYMVVSDSGSDRYRKLVLLSRYPIKSYKIHSEKIRVGNSYQKFSRAPIEAIVQISKGFNVKVYALHLKSKIGGSKAERKRLAEARAVARWVKRDLKENPEANVIVLGDFNDGSNSETMKILDRAGLENPRRLEKLRNHLVNVIESSLARKVSEDKRKKLSKTVKGVKILTSWFADLIGPFKMVKVFYNADADRNTFNNSRYSETLDHILLSPSLMKRYSIGSYQIFNVPLISSASDHSLLTLDIEVGSNKKE